jgi:scyllo-inositol 2-dehydrogenase (NADP+)
VIRIVAVGCGWVSLHRHIPAIRANPAYRLVGVVDRDGDKARRSAQELRVAHATTLDDPALGGFDAVSIGTAPTSHHALVMAGLSLGKHVIVEKPFAMSVAEADEMVARAKERGLVLAVVHNFQFARSVAAARLAAAEQRYGALRGVVGLQLSNDRRRLPEWYRTLPGGLFYDEGPHLLYLARAFLGDTPIVSAFTLAGPDPGDRTPRFVDVRFAAGPDRPFGALHMSFAAALSEWQLFVLCDRATLVCDIFRDILVTLPDDGRHHPGQIFRSSVAGSLGHWAGVATSGLRFVTGRLDYGNAEVFRRFARAITDGVAPSGISGEDGRAVVAALHRTLAGG